MPYFTTGLIDNTAAAGVRPSSTLAIAISNNDTSTALVQIEGFFLSGTTKEKFVEDLFTLAAGTMSLRNYFVQFEAFEFNFFVSLPAVGVSAWRKDPTGTLNSAHQVDIEELDTF